MRVSRDPITLQPLVEIMRKRFVLKKDVKVRDLENLTVDDVECVV